MLSEAVEKTRKKYQENLKAEKNFLTYKDISDQGYFLSNYVMVNGRDETDVMISKKQAKALNNPEILINNYEVERKKKPLGKLFEEKDISVKLYSTLLKSLENGKEELMHQFEKVIDTDERYLDVEPLNQGNAFFGSPTAITEHWGASTYINGDRIEWRLKGINWPMVLDLLENEGLRTYRDLEEMEVVYNDLIT